MSEQPAARPVETSKCVMTVSPDTGVAALEELANLAERLQGVAEARELLLSVLDGAASLIRVQSLATVGADAILCLKPSQRLLDLLAALRAIERDRGVK